jgi:hypothetical protein
MPKTKNKEKRQKMQKASDDQLKEIAQTCVEIIFEMAEIEETHQCSIADQLKAYGEITTNLMATTASSIGINIGKYARERDFLRMTARHGLGRAVSQDFFPDKDLAKLVIKIRRASIGELDHLRQLNDLKLIAKKLREYQGFSSSNRTLIARAVNESEIGDPSTSKASRNSRQHKASDADLQKIQKTCDDLTLIMAAVEGTEALKLDDQLVEYQDTTYQLISDVAKSFGERIEDYPNKYENDFLAGTRRGLPQAVYSKFFPATLARLVIDIRRVSTLGQGHLMTLYVLRERAEALINDRNKTLTSPIHLPSISALTQHSSAQPPVPAVPALHGLPSASLQQHIPSPETTLYNITAPPLSPTEAALLQGLAREAMDHQRPKNQYQHRS